MHYISLEKKRRAQLKKRTASPTIGEAMKRFHGGEGDNS